jgi:hypothetical protein
MSDDESGKKVGVFGGLIAAIGMLLARGADDCARVGAMSAKGAAPMMDDAARISARGAGHVAGAGDDGLRAAGRAGGLADEAAHPFGNSSRFAAGDDALGAAAATGDDAFGAAARSGDDWLGESLDTAIDLVSSVDFEVGGEVDDPASPTGPDPNSTALSRSMDSKKTRASWQDLALSGVRPFGVGAALKRRLVEAPTAVAAVPSTHAAYVRMFGVEPQGRELGEMSFLLKLLDQPVKEVGMNELAAMLAERRASNPVTILGYTDGSDIKLALPSGERVSDVNLHEACMKVGMNCFVLACDEKVPADGELCVRSAYFTWSVRSTQAVSGERRKTLGGLARALMLPPSAYAGPPMVLSRVVRSPDGKLQLVRTRPKSSRPAP